MNCIILKILTLSLFLQVLKPYSLSGGDFLMDTWSFHLISRSYEFWEYDRERFEDFCKLHLGHFIEPLIL